MAWSGEAKIGTATAKQVALGLDATDRVNIFCIQSDDTIAWYSPQPAGWLGPAQLAASAKQMCVTQRVGGLMEVIYVGLDGNLYHTWQDLSLGGLWHSPVSLGGQASQVVACPGVDGATHIFYRGAGDFIYHNWTDPASSNGWHGAEPLYGQGTLLVVGQNRDGTLEIFYGGLGPGLYHNYQTKDGWSGETTLGESMVTSLALGRNADGGQLVFYIDDEGRIGTFRQTVSGWQEGSVAGTAAAQTAAAPNLDSNAELFYIGQDSVLYHNWQNTAQPGAWHGEAALGGSAKQLVAGQDSSGFLEVVYIGMDDCIYRNFKTQNGPMVVGAPPGVPLTGLVGALRFQDTVLVFGAGIDGGLWGRDLSAAGAPWVNLGKPAAGLNATGNNSNYAAVLNGEAITVFCVDENGSIASAQSMDGSAWTWLPPTNPGAKIASITGATSVPLVLYATDTDGRGWCATITGGMGQWIQGYPATTFGSSAVVAWIYTQHTINWRSLVYDIASLGLAAATASTADDPTNTQSAREGVDYLESNLQPVSTSNTTWMTLDMAYQGGRILCNIFSGTGADADTVSEFAPVAKEGVTKEGVTREEVTREGVTREGNVAQPRIAAWGFAFAGVLFFFAALIPLFFGRGLNVAFLPLGLLFLILAGTFGKKKIGAGDA
jgi:hypothetical protein